MNGGLFAGGSNAEAHPDFVGDGGDVGPHAFADAEVQALEDEFTVEGGHVLSGRVAQRHDHLAASALAREGAAHLVAIVTKRAHLAGDERRLRVSAAVEPQLAGRFVVGLGRAGVDAGEIDLDLCMGGLGFRRIKHHLRGEALEAALHRHAHLAELEADAALLRQHAAVLDRMRRRRGQCRQHGEQGWIVFHVRSFLPQPMRCKNGWRSIKWCCRAAPTCRTTSTSRLKFRALCTSVRRLPSSRFFSTRSGNGSTPNHTVWTPLAELISHPDSGIAIIRTYKRPCTIALARRCQPATLTGSGGGVCVSLQLTRMATSSSTVMPIHL